MNEIEISREIENIKERNKRVEADKAWEISFTRRLFISLVTYVTAGVWLVLIKDSYPWLKAFVPTAGYLLSTLSLPVIKDWWIKNQKK
ncbi:MAG TPA: hypothetical protein VGQ87_02875 [Patescibacteria group bacterium]|jgi:hypothetical protein|nr:hypothetical protein [Patescibacteria group bacterium]